MLRALSRHMGKHPRYGKNAARVIWSSLHQQVWPHAGSFLRRAKKARELDPGGGSRVFGGRPTFARIFHFRTDLTFARIFRFSSPHFRKLVDPKSLQNPPYIEIFVGSLRSPQDRSLRSEGRSKSVIYDRLALFWLGERSEPAKIWGSEGRFDRIWPAFRPVGGLSHVYSAARWRGVLSHVYSDSMARHTFARIFRKCPHFRILPPQGRDTPSLSHSTRGAPVLVASPL